MNLSEEKIGEILLLKIGHYEATIVVAKDFKETLINYIEDGNKKILLDFTEIDLMDSTFLGALVVALRKMKEVGGEIKIFGVSESVSLVFGLTKMKNYFDICDSKEEAIQSFD